MSESSRRGLTGALVVAGIVALITLRPRAAGVVGVFGAIIVMIMVHELGHFVMAKRAGMKVTEFFLGFGPRLWSIRRGETEYGVKAIPAGGYVKIIGMNNLEEVDPADEERTYRAKRYRDRLGVAVAGSTMHFVMAYVLLVLVFGVAGTPVLRPIVSQVIAGSPAQESEFAVGDRIVAINGKEIEEWEEVQANVRRHGEEALVFTVERGDRTLDIPVTPEMSGTGDERRPMVGLGPKEEMGTVSLPEAMARSAKVMPDFAWETISTLGGIFSPSGVQNYGQLLSGSEDADDSKRLVSPIGVADMAGRAVDDGWSRVLFLLFAINIFVGIFNMVPLPPLDGGHVAVATYEKVASMVTGRRVQADFAKLMPVAAAVLALLVVMGVSAIYLDIVRKLP